MTGQDIICQAKAGMGKTAVFVISILQQIVPEDDKVDTIVIAHTRELAFQICAEFMRFTKYLTDVKVSTFYGGIPIKQHHQLLADQPTHIAIGTPGRMKSLIADKKLKTQHVKRFVIDECDHVFESLEMRRDVQTIFKACPHDKQVMLFSATFSKDSRTVASKFTNNPAEVYVDESKLTLYGLQQHYLKIDDSQKNRKLHDLLKKLEYNQVVIFVSSTQRCKILNDLLTECKFPVNCIYGGLKQELRLDRYNKFKKFEFRIMVATDIFARGVDFERVNIVINYDMPNSADLYLHRVGRSGRFGTKGLAISMVSTDADVDILNEVQSRFEVEVPALPDEIDVAAYMNWVSQFL